MDCPRTRNNSKHLFSDFAGNSSQDPTTTTTEAVLAVVTQAVTDRVTGIGLITETATTYGTMRITSPTTPGTKRTTMTRTATVLIHFHKDFTKMIKTGILTKLPGMKLKWSKPIGSWSKLKPDSPC